MRKMEPQRWKEIDGIFAAALELDSAEQAGFVAQVCGGDEQLRKEVESLLAHVMPDELAGGPAFEEATRLLADDVREPEINTVGPYQIIELLGAGGMGRVYLAHDPRLNRRVAVKLLSRYNVAESERIRRFRQEAFAASALNHPNILTIYEIGDFEGQHFLATEFIDGETLRALLSRSRPGLLETLDMAIQVASALVAAHKAGIVHRDIKPENIMVRRDDGIAKVLDFGLVKLTEKYAPQQADSADPAGALVNTDTGAVMGTASYMSPEQARGLAVDARTDIWSLGVVLYGMLAGRLPFEGVTASDVIASILKTEPPPLARLVPEAPAELERIVSKSLAKDGEERYVSEPAKVADL